MVEQQATNSADNVVRAGPIEKAANDLLAVLKHHTVSIEIPGVGVGSDVFFLLVPMIHSLLVFSFSSSLR